MEQEGGQEGDHLDLHERTSQQRDGARTREREREEWEGKQSKAKQRNAKAKTTGGEEGVAA